MSDNTPAIRQHTDAAPPARYVGPNSWGDLVRQAEVLYRSNLLPKSVRSAEAAIAIIQTGRELQLNPMEAFRAVHVIEGTPTVSPRCKLGLIQRSGLLTDYRITEGDGWAECTMKRKGLPSPITCRFTLEEAKAAGLAGKDNWRKWPKNMLRWRAIGYVADQLFSDITGGHFTPDELGAETDEEGVPVENQPNPPSIDPDHMRRVNEAWDAAQAAGWSASQVGTFLRNLGASKKSEVTPQMLDALHAAITPLDTMAVEAEIVAEEDWSNDPALEGI